MGGNLCEIRTNFIVNEDLVRKVGLFPTPVLKKAAEGSLRNNESKSYQSNTFGAKIGGLLIHTRIEGTYPYLFSCYL